MEIHKLIEISYFKMQEIASHMSMDIGQALLQLIWFLSDYLYLGSQETKG